MTSGEEVLNWQAFIMLIIGAILLFVANELKKFLSFASKWMDNFYEKQEEKFKEDKLNKSIEEGVYLANQTAKVVSQDKNIKNLSDTNLKQIALDHIQKTAGSMMVDLDPEILDSKIEAQVAKANPSTKPIIEIEPPAQIDITTPGNQ